MEHERFKNAAQMLLQKQQIEAATWTNPAIRQFRTEEGTEPEMAADTVDLVRVFREVLDRARQRPVLEVDEEAVTVSQMVDYVRRRLIMEERPVSLSSLLRNTRSERALICMFLALLELVRLQAVLLSTGQQLQRGLHQEAPVVRVGFESRHDAGYRRLALE